MDNATNLAAIPVPIMTRELFSTFTGLTSDTIRGMIENGHIPSVKVGRHRMINIALLTDEMLQEAWEK